jgi:hypothetical protein
MYWLVWLFWAFVAVFCVHIALQIYYANRVSRVDQIKIQMARLEPVPYFPSRNDEKPPLLATELYTAIAGIADEFYKGIRWLRQAILSVLSPKLYAFVG